MKDKFAVTLYEYKDDNKTISPLDVIKEGTFLTISEDNELKDWYIFTIHIDSNSSSDKKEKLKGLIPCSYVKYPVSRSYNAILDREFQSFDEFYYLVLKRIDILDDSIDQEKLIQKLSEIYDNDKLQPNKKFFKEFPFPNELVSAGSVDKYSKFNKFILYLIIRIDIFDITTFPYEWLFKAWSNFSDLVIGDKKLSKCANQFLSIYLSNQKQDPSLRKNIFNLHWLLGFANYIFTPISDTFSFDLNNSDYLDLTNNSFFKNLYNSRSSHVKFLFIRGFITHFFNSSKVFDTKRQELLFQSFKLLISNKPLDFKDQIMIDNYIMEFVKKSEKSNSQHFLCCLLMLNMISDSQEPKLSKEIIESVTFNLWGLFSYQYTSLQTVIQQFKFNSNYIDQLEIEMFKIFDSDGRWEIFFNGFSLLNILDSKSLLFSYPNSNLMNYLNPTVLMDILNCLSIDSDIGKNKIREIGNQYIKSFEIKNKNDIIDLIKLSTLKPNYLSKLSSNTNDLLFSNFSDQIKSILIQDEFIFIISKEIKNYYIDFDENSFTQENFPELFYISFKFGFSLDTNILINGIGKLENTLYINDDRIPLTIPKTIDTLHILNGYNQMISPSIITNSIQYLYLYNINIPLTVGSIPKNVKELHLLHGFNQVLTPGIIPDSIQHLYIYGKQPSMVGSIPSTVKDIHYEDGPDQCVTLPPAIIPEKIVPTKSLLEEESSICELNNTNTKD